ncbi:MAG: hypothetical protein EBR82_45590, partial [Caulobacteraceae bacterium]|nr:hypothetical protein [Caulobacteraceae bacterium]
AQQIEALRAENDKLRQVAGLQRARQFRLPDEIRTSLGANRPEGASGVEGLEYILGAAIQTTEERLQEYYENRLAEIEKRLAPVQETLEQQRAREQHEQAVQSATVAINTAIAPLMADPAAKWLFDDNNAGHPVVVQFGQELGRFGHECIQGRGVIEENGRRFSVPAGPISPMILQHYAAQMLQRYRAYVPGGAPVANPSAIDGAQSLAGGAPMNGRNVQGAPPSVSLRDALTPGARGRLLRN